MLAPLLTRRERTAAPGTAAGHSTAVIDPCAVLAGMGAGVAGAGCTATPVSGGWDTSIWRVQLPGRGGRDYALRLFRAEQEATCAREVAAMRAAGVAVPVPRVVLRGAWEGRPALLMDWAPGAPLLEALRARPWETPLLGMAFGETQARLHREAPLPPTRDGQQRGWIEWAGDDAGAVQARLRALPAQRTALLHLDYHPLNVLVEGGAGRPAGRRRRLRRAGLGQRQAGRRQGGRRPHPLHPAPRARPQRRSAAPGAGPAGAAGGRLAPGVPAGGRGRERPRTRRTRPSLTPGPGR